MRLKRRERGLFRYAYELQSNVYESPGTADATSIRLSVTDMVDIKQGSFNNNSALEIADWTASATTTNALVVTNENMNGWFEYELTPSLSSVNVGIDSTEPDNHTQFRIYFPNGTTANRNEGWYSGESSGNNARPQLIVRYS